MKNKRSKKLVTLLLVMIVLFSACGAKQDMVSEKTNQVEKKNQKAESTDSENDASKPLEFLKGSFHDESGFTFDGFTITADYQIMEERLALTEQQPEVELADNGNTTTLIFNNVVMEEDPNVVGNFVYVFYKNQFLRGSMSISFSDYEAARDFIWELEEELNTVKIPVSELEQQMEEEGYEGYLFQDLQEPEEWEAPSYSAGYVDRRGISMQTNAVKKILEGGKEVGVVTIFFIENVPGGGAQKNNSQYFDFEELSE